MQMSERQWRVLSLLERLERGEVTVGEVAASLGRSRRQVQRMRKRLAKQGAPGLVHGNAGRSPKHRTPQELREQVVVLRRGKYAGFNDQHFTEKLVEVEGLELSRETVRRILREAGIGSPRKRRPPKHRQRRERKAQAGQMILWDGSEHDWLEGRGPRLCLMGAIDDATGELLPGAHFTKQECTVGYLRVLRDILLHKGIPHTVYGDRHSSLRRNDKHWTLEEELAGRQEPTQVGRALANLGVETRYALSAQAKGRVERLWGVLQDRLISELRLAGASTRGQANEVLRAYRLAHNKRFAVEPKDAQPAWRKAPSDHTKVLDLCALHYVRKVYKNHTVRINGCVVDIPRRPDAPYATYAGKEVTVKHLLSGDYRVFYDGQCIAWARGERPKPNLRQSDKTKRRQEKSRNDNVG
jgi:transposase